MWGVRTGGRCQRDPSSWTKEERRRGLLSGSLFTASGHPSSWKAGPGSVFGVHWLLLLSRGPGPRKDPHLAMCASCREEGVVPQRCMQAAPCGCIRPCVFPWLNSLPQETPGREEKNVGWLPSLRPPYPREEQRLTLAGDIPPASAPLMPGRH